MIYQNDGSLTYMPYEPVKWILGEKPICLPLNEIIAKSARPLQPLNERITLKSKK